MAENVAPSPAKRARKPNFTPAECAVILEEAEENINIIKSKFSSTLCNKNKTRIWEEITEKVNALGVSKRTVVEVKEKWRGMVSGAKREHNKCTTAVKKTGGGKKPASPKATTAKIIELFETDPSFSGILGGIDSGKPLMFTSLLTYDDTYHSVLIVSAVLCLNMTQGSR
ncbi:t-SNARE domain-containing protein 1-like [Stylophora pistillata]|uniref:t-SNARE domain-containing protein 1-like n=1 Tax=Stylophora pistillata TaxID=50429 RepID=UPI000C04E54F|nr:t-SNARE domain-containing protein 1-like [Stylophora pistillata]